MKTLTHQHRHPVKEFFFITAARGGLLVVLIMILTTAVYGQTRNTWTGTSPFPTYAALGYSNADWGDYDNDGDFDLLTTGESDTGEFTGLYRNDGADTFTMMGQIPSRWSM
jgi:hypothetical protein